jgi:23S rRNA G2445 N2-methylase RlmL
VDEPQQLVAALVPQLQPAPEKSVRPPQPPNALDKLRFRVAEKRYNQTIWQQIKTRLLFFQKLNKLERTTIEARIRLSIDASGRIVECALLFPSRSRLFNQELLKAVDALELPPPQEALVRNPPYVVNITLKP